MLCIPQKRSIVGRLRGNRANNPAGVRLTRFGSIRALLQRNLPDYPGCHGQPGTVYDRFTYPD
jgi:hypothetical protein